jgi:hypothetical protein
MKLIQKSEPALIPIKNKFRLLNNRNQTDNQIFKAIKINYTDIWLRSENSLQKKKKKKKNKKQKKTTPGQPNLRNQLSKEITSFKKFVLTIIYSSHSL